jgi:tetratricopeptide (TPR) repeat protein
VDHSTSVCPNCGAPLEKPSESADTIEQVSPLSSPRPSDNLNNDNPESNEIPQTHRNEDEDIEICDPGDLLCADQPETRPTEESEPIGQTTPPADPDFSDDEAKSDSSEDSQPSIQKLSEEQVNNIRSNLLKSEPESEFVTAENASSIIHDLSNTNEGPTLQRNDRDGNKKTDDKPDYSGTVSTPGFSDDTSSATNPMSSPKSAPSRKVAYFHKNFIQLTGPIHPTSGEEMVIEDRHYLLKPKKIKPQYTIGIASVLAVLLLFLIGKQFISPTLPGDGSIIGVILDQDGRPLISGAEIALPESGKKVKSDAIGFFRFNNVPTGVYNIQYTLPDGRIGSEDISVANDEITTLSLSATEATKKYSRKTSTKSDNRRSSSNTGRKSSSKSMPSIPEEKKQEALQTKQSGKAYSALKLIANVNNAKLIVNGQVLGSGNLTYKKLAPGKHKAKVTKEGYKAWSGQIRLEPDETFTLAVDLEKVQVKEEEPSYSADDFYQSGQTMFADGNVEAAVQDFTEAINMKPSMADAYVSRAEAYTAGGKTILAENDYIRAGEIYATQKRNESALDCFRKAISINKKSIAALINRGDLYKKLNAKEKALNDYKQAVKYGKNNFRANFELGKMYFSMGKHKDADKRLRKARDLDPSVPQVYHYLMLNYFARDDFGKVKKTYGTFKDNVSEDQQQAFKDNPRYDAILRIVGEYERP